MCSCWSLELLIGDMLKYANTGCSKILYIYPGAQYTAYTFISAICESVVYSKAGDYYETSTERIIDKVEE